VRHRRTSYNVSRGHGICYGMSTWDFAQIPCRKSNLSQSNPSKEDHMSLPTITQLSQPSQANCSDVMRKYRKVWIHGNVRQRACALTCAGKKHCSVRLRPSYIVGLPEPLRWALQLQTTLQSYFHIPCRNLKCEAVSCLPLHCENIGRLRKPYTR